MVLLWRASYQTCLAEKGVLNKPTEEFDVTRPKPAYGRQGLDWIVGPGYSFVVFSTVGQSDHFS